MYEYLNNLETDKHTVEKILEYLQSLQVKFEVMKDESPYNQAFVKKIEKSRQQAIEGKTTRIKTADL